MSVLLAPPPSIAMHSSPAGFHADYIIDKQRNDCLPACQRTRSPRLLHRAVGGRISRGQSTPVLSLSARNQQILWETVTGRSWQPEQLSEDFQSLQYITPHSLTVSPVPSVAPSSPTVTLESASAVISPAGTVPEPLDSHALLSSMEFMMASNYGNNNHNSNNLGSYSTSYATNYMDPYREASQEDIKPRIASPHSAYAPAYATATESSPAQSPGVESSERASTSSYSYTSPRPPYEAAAAPAGAYAYAHAHAQTHPSGYASSYATSQDPYTTSQYGAGYGHPPGAYLPHPASSYPAAAYAAGTAYAPSPTARTERSVNTSQPRNGEYLCWQHGCNGKKFSTLSNLLRHERERGGSSTKSLCRKCGAEFTRTTARNGHEIHNKCKKRLTPTDS